MSNDLAVRNSGLSVYAKPAIALSGTELIQHRLSNGNTIVYKVVNGTAYHVETVSDVIYWLESERYERNRRLVLEYGDAATGQSWESKFCESGYIGRSTGGIQIPLIVHNTRSMGGGAILDHCIVRILLAKGKRVLYQNPDYKPAKDS